MPLKQIPLKSLFGYAEANLPKFSPDGTKYSFLAPHGDTPPTLWLSAGPGKPATCIFTDTDRPLIEYSWAHTNNHIIFRRDHDGDENWHLYILDIRTGKVAEAISRPNVRVHSYFISAHAPETVIVIMNSRDRTLYDAYNYNLITGRLQIMSRNDGTVKSWHVDKQLKVRAKVAYNGNGSFYLYARASARSKWYHAHTWLPDDTFTSGPLFFSPDGRYLYLTDASNTNTNSLCVLDTRTGSITPLVHDGIYDVFNGAGLDDLITNILPYPSKTVDDSGTLTGFSYYKEKLTWHFLPDNKPVNGLQKLLAHPSYQQWVVSETPTTALIGRCRDTIAPHYVLYNKEDDTVTPLCSLYPALAKHTLVNTQPVSFPARDGIMLHGYLTLPPDSKNAPLIVRAHGGPWARDIGGYQPEVQFLANRGYACLQVNFRGSTGYGKTLVNAGNKEWGGRIIDDLADAANWACTQGLATPKRMAVMGRSFGGYATLCASWRYKELFACALAVVPPTHLPRTLETLPIYWRPFLTNFYDRLGHPHKDRARLRTFSPALNAHKISLPLFLSYGMRDIRVPHEQTERLLQNLNTPEQPLTVVAFPNEGHRLQREENIIHFYEQMEQFLTTHLPLTTTD